MAISRSRPRIGRLYGIVGRVANDANLPDKRAEWNSAFRSLAVPCRGTLSWQFGKARKCFSPLLNGESALAVIPNRVIPCRQLVEPHASALRSPAYIIKPDVDGFARKYHAVVSWAKSVPRTIRSISAG